MVCEPLSHKMFKPNNLKMISLKLARQLTNTCPSSFLALIIAKPVATSIAGQLRAFSVKPKGKTRVPAAFASAGYDGSTNASSSEQKASYARSSLLRSVRHDQMQYSPSLFGPLSPGFDDLFSNHLVLAPFLGRGLRIGPVTDIMPVIKKNLEQVNMTLLRSSPGYEIKESPGMYQIVIDVPQGIKAADLKVELAKDKSVLHVAGQRKAEKDGCIMSHYSFVKHFSIGPNIDIESVKANLDDDVLIVTARKVHVHDSSPDNLERIPITVKPHEMMTDEELVQKSFSDAFDESDWAEAGKAVGEKVA